MLLVSLTGGIASGKSVIGEILHRRGCHLHAADRTARDLQAPGQPAYGPILARFGREILAPDATIDRRKLAAVVFADPREREALNAIVHPFVFAAMRETAARLAAEGKVRIFVNEAALTIEAGFVEYFDKIVVAYCPPDVQMRRLAARDGLSAEDARRRIEAQMPAGEKLAYADYVVDTSGTIEETVARAEALYESLLLDEKVKRQDCESRRLRD
jgi:dephospho-CoA kinase